jgi:outer membrane protein assembly factor BamB
MALLCLGQPASGGPSGGGEPPGGEAAALTLVWQDDLGHCLGRSLAVSGGRVAAATLDRRVALLSLASGDRQWRIKRGIGTQAGVSAGGTHVVGISDLPQGELFALSSDDGLELWSVRLGESWGAPLLRGGLVYAAALNGRVVACSLGSGSLQWSRRVPGLVRAPLAIDDSLLLVPTVSDTLLALHAASGAEIWQAAPGGALYGPPVRHAGLLWSLSYRGHLVGWDPASGSARRRLQLEGRFRSGLVAAEGMLIALEAGGLLVAVDPEHMQVRWQEDLKSASELPPTYGANLIWTAVRDGTLRAFRPADGQPCCEVILPAAPTTSVAVADPYVLVGVASGELLAYTLGGPQGAVRGPGPKMKRRSAAHRGPLLLWAGALGAPAPVTPVRAASRGPVLEARGLRSLSGELCTQGRPESAASRRPWWRGDRLYVAGWILGTGLALVLQEEANRSFERYERVGDPARRAEAWDRAERYDRYALGAWAAGEVCFLLALRCWLSGD